MRQSGILRCTHTPNLGFPYSNYIRDMLFLKTRSDVKEKVTISQKWYDSRKYVKGQGHRDPRMVHDTLSYQDACIPNFGFLPQIIQEICSGNEFSKN